MADNTFDHISDCDLETAIRVCNDTHCLVTRDALVCIAELRAEKHKRATEIDNLALELRDAFFGDSVRRDDRVHGAWTRLAEFVMSTHDRKPKSAW